MEAALLSGTMKAMLPKLFSLVEKSWNLHKDIKRDIQFLEKELGMILRSIDDELSAARDDRGAVLLLSIEDLRELAHGIEDCIDSLVYRASWKQQSSSLRRRLQSPKALLTGLQFAQKLQRMKQLVVEAHERRQRYPVPGQAASAAQADGSPSSASFDPRLTDADLVGVDEPRAKLLEQLAAAAEGQPVQLKVISIVGSWGSGKTALAADVYRIQAGSERFDKHAWVCAGLKTPGEVLADLLRGFSSDGHSCPGNVLNASNVGQLCVQVREQLVKKRYFIVIDDIQTQDQWKIIKSAFPDENDGSSRVVVTTTIQSVANACSSDNGYVHKMSRLDEKCSKELFSKKACPEKYSQYKQPDPTAILKKCDGQPLALVTIGQFLQSNGWPRGPACEDVCNNIGYHLETEETFEKMRRVLMRNYANLPGHALKACLLYFGIFPSDNPVRRKSLLRRWSAEGIVETQDSCDALALAAKNFNKLVDQNFIEPIDVSNNNNVKTCQTYGMMREFILQLSISQNFVTLFCDDKKEEKYVRRLSLHHKNAKDGESFKNIDLSLVRSLTIFGKACKTVLDFSKYELLRVLDLEKCDDLKDDHIKGICNLLLLKYLSLGGSVTELPEDIVKLEHLEALDVRRTKVNILPVEVFLLPCLMHILGEFRLSGKVYKKSVFLKKKTGNEVQKFLSEGKSNIETLAGFVTDGSDRFLHLMGHMNRLRKVKIWCKPSASSTDWTDLRRAIQQFIQDKKDENNDTTRSLSLHFDECFENFLDSVTGPCYLSSLKLHGSLTALPQFFVSLRGLRELCLSTTKLTTGVLEGLSNLSYLQYLKLIARDIEDFVIEVQALPRLLCLCFELQNPTLPTIKQGAMRFLVTLQLLCKDINGFSGINIECFEHLEEVILHPKVSQETQKQWEKAAEEHPNGPKIVLLKPGDEAEAESSDDQLNPAFSNMGISEISPALNELPSVIVVP
ncbi:disease resistance protein RGA4-like [Triticum urartu]|uniref:Disease resistance protein RPM1 n=1 Tax=Triticum urartu TaxID=4572 RepID=A0A8R7V454_TRIUA|nr:disease resistance protein RGA4-like [Triticum urartu]XP_048542402.1 disease resistance protein RGA4-like [Triticum urartu]